MTTQRQSGEATLLLAEAFLAGPWTEDDLLERGGDFLDDWTDVEACVAAALATYRTRPWDRPYALAETLREALTPHVRRRTPSPPPPPVRRWRTKPLADVDALAVFAGMARSELQWYVDLRGMGRTAADERLRHYRYRWVPSRHRPARLIEAPKDRLKLVQRRILREVLAPVPVSPIAHGYVPGRSAVTAAEVHVGAEVVVQADLASFFPSVSYARVRAIFAALGNVPGVAEDLAGLCTTVTPAWVLRERPMPTTPGASPLSDRFHADRRLSHPHLPQGAPTSPALANLACFGLDRRLSGLAAAFQANVTRYADDITFSGGRLLRSHTGDLLALLRTIVAEESFALAPSKTRVTTRARQQRVLGMVVNERRSLDRRWLERLEATLVNCGRTGPGPQNRDGHPDFRAHLAGQLAWVADAAPHKVGRLRVLFERIVWD